VLTFVEQLRTVQQAGQPWHSMSRTTTEFYLPVGRHSIEEVSHKWSLPGGCRMQNKAACQAINITQLGGYGYQRRKSSITKISDGRYLWTSRSETVLRKPYSLKPCVPDASVGGPVSHQIIAPLNTIHSLTISSHHA
jgi:hypothetical protein